ncbi:MAG: hypothetical protein AB1603_08450, partial [Chloroflexota bacterium]
KVYIIDEVHMLTDAAGNALLKTLEEPPPYVIFVLATTEPHKLLPTILSRCQRYDFRRLGQSAIVSRLTHICAREGVDVQPEALNLIARSATGSLRDAVNLLEQMVTHYGTHVELTQVQATLGVTGDLRARELARHLIARDTAAALQTLNSVVGDGLDLRQFHRELVEYLRQLLLVKCGSSAAVDATGEDTSEMQRTVSEASLDHVLETVKLLGRIDLRLDNYSPLPLEMAAVECCLVREESTQAPKRPALSLPKGAQPRQVGTTGISPRADQAPAERPRATATPAAAPQAPKEPAPVSDWEKVLQAVKSANKNLAVRLKDCELVSLEDGTAVLRFAHSFHKDKVEEPEYRKIIEDALNKVLGKPCRMSCVLEPRDKKPQQQAAQQQGHLVKAALELGAKIISTEEQHE